MTDQYALSQPPAAPDRGAGLRTLRRMLPVDILSIVALPVGAAIATLVLWQVFVRVAGVPAAILPPPTDIVDQITAHYGLLLKHAVPTTLETLLAFGIAIPLGILLAALMTCSTILNRAFYPNIIFFQLIPKIALAPMFIVWLGIGLPSRVTFSVFISFFPILIATATGLQAISRDTLRLCRSVGASDWQILFYVRFPTSLPYIFSGMKIAVTLAIIGIVVGEFIASQAGLGYLILFASSRQQADLGLACITVLCGIGLLFYGAVALGEKIMMKLYGDR
ncbi:MAG: ABC transporter permease [Pseudomonadota bacterium]